MFQETISERITGLTGDFIRMYAAIGAVVLFVLVHAIFYPERDHEQAMQQAPTFGL